MRTFPWHRCLAARIRSKAVPHVIDGPSRKLLDPVLDAVGRRLARAGVTANAVTLAGFALAGIAAFLIAFQLYLAGLAFILVSRLCDGLDGAVARATRRTDFGGYLDIVLDFAFYGLIPLAFAIADPAANAVAAGILLLSFYVNGGSFLAFAAIAEKRGFAGEARGSKSFLFSTGLAEAGETLAAFVAMCLFPDWFPVLAGVFAAMVFFTAATRILRAWRSFG
jgi:phosphatidylglycerophosphate synthase